tara:strand:- start:481 stop:678 length:198 start_codon:yes stop_codon:yes gene_type:complete
MEKRRLEYGLLCVVSNNWCKCIMLDEDPKTWWVYKQENRYICKKEFVEDLERVGRLDLLAKEIKT